MLSTLVLSFHLMCNDHFLGDRKQLEAIQSQVEKKFDTYTLKTTEYQDDNPAAVSTLKTNLAKAEAGAALLTVSGSHGFQFLTKDEVQAAIAPQKPITLWVGHQDPGLIKHQDKLSLVALPVHIIEDKLALEKTFGKRLVALEAVPNTLQEKDLAPALLKWNTTYPDEAIVENEEGDMGIFLGGPAPKPENGSYLFESLEAIQQRGLQFGQMAELENKKLRVVNGPRTGKFYPESPDLSDPILRQFDEHGWIPFDKLTAEQREITVNKLAAMAEPKKKEISKTLVHTHGAPLDPETVAFMEGVKQSGVSSSQYQLFDFKATPGEPTKSAYAAVIAVLHKNKDKSHAFYSGESISYAEISYLIPRTYAFTTGTMNQGHTNALNRFSQTLHMVGVLDFKKRLAEQPIDLAKKAGSIQNGSQQDAIRIANALQPILTERLRNQER